MFWYQNLEDCTQLWPHPVHSYHVWGNDLRAMVWIKVEGWSVRSISTPLNPSANNNEKPPECCSCVGLAELGALGDHFSITGSNKTPIGSASLMATGRASGWGNFQLMLPLTRWSMFGSRPWVGAVLCGVLLVSGWVRPTIQVRWTGVYDVMKWWPI